jgi:hypothetical protein
MMIIVGWTQALVITGLYGNDPVNYFSVQNNVAGQSNSCSCWHLAKFVVSSVADPGCLSRIPDPDFYPSRIPDPKTATKERGEKN